MKVRFNPVIIDTQWALHVLSQYFETMDRQLQEAARIENSALESKLRLAPQMEDWERQDLIQSHHEYYEKHFPTKLRYSFVLLVWSTVETQLKATCDRVAKQFRRKLTLADIHGDNTLSRCGRYLEKVACIEIADKTLWSEMQTFQKLRNAIIHANGLLKDLKSEGEHPHFQQYFKRNLGLSLDPWGAVAIGPAYCRHVIDASEKLFHAIFEACNWEPDKQGQIIK